MLLELMSFEQRSVILSFFFVHLSPIKMFPDKSHPVVNYLLCREGATGDEIIEALIANSATFEKKTLFSQVIMEGICFIFDKCNFKAQK